MTLSNHVEVFGLLSIVMKPTAILGRVSESADRLVLKCAVVGLFAVHVLTEHLMKLLHERVRFQPSCGFGFSRSHEEDPHQAARVLRNAARLADLCSLATVEKSDSDKFKKLIATFEPMDQTSLVHHRLHEFNASCPR